MTDRTAGPLVCVYYRVATPDVARAIAAVREFQRTLRLKAGVAEAEVLLRCQLNADCSAADVHQAPRLSSDDSLPAEAEADATVMETYRLAFDADARAFLAALAAAASPLAGLLRGERHVELFAPCAS